MNLKRLAAVVAVLATLTVLTAAPQAQQASGPGSKSAPKTLHYAFPIAETGFDPVKLQDLYSRIITAHLYDALYEFDYLARPSKVRPRTAAALPEVNADFTSFTIHLKPGTHFADDPAFGGKPRELVAQDYVYAFKRYFDPANKAPAFNDMHDQGFIGLDAVREESLKAGKPFDYDREVPGLRAIDRYTLQIRLEKPRPRLLYTLADSGLYGAVAREVIERYGGEAAAHPVGTGPFRLAAWRRSSLVTLERNPGYREVLYDAEPADDDAEGQALLKQFKGRRLPMIDRVEVAIIEESQPRWLSFLNRQQDLVFGVPLDFSSQALPNGKLAPNLARQGIRLYRIANPDRTLSFFNMENPTVGGYTPDKVALRRAISLAMDVQSEISLVRRGQALVAQTLVAPGTWGYDPSYKTENSDYDVPRAKALLDMYGYVDRNGDGWRDMPDGSPLVIEYASQPSALDRQFDQLWKKNLDAIGIQLKVKTAQWPEQLKAARSGQLMVWQLGYTASSPDVQDGLQLLYGGAIPGGNLARFRNARFDALYEQMQSLPDGPQRRVLLDEALRIAVAYAPHKYSVHRIVNDLAHPWLLGFRRPLFGNQFWQYVDIDDSLRPAH